MPWDPHPAAHPMELGRYRGYWEAPALKPPHLLPSAVVMDELQARAADPELSRMPPGFSAPAFFSAGRVFTPPEPPRTRSRPLSNALLVPSAARRAGDAPDSSRGDRKAADAGAAPAGREEEGAGKVLPRRRLLSPA